MSLLDYVDHHTMRKALDEWGCLATKNLLQEEKEE
jgi:hypothetical protein